MGKAKTFEQLLAEAENFVFGDALLESVETLGFEGVVNSFVLLQQLADLVDKRKEQLRKWLLPYIEQNGKPTDKGGQIIFMHNTKVQREQRKSKVPDEAGLRALLEKHEIPLDKAFSKITNVVLDPSKVDVLVKLGTLPEKDVEALKKIVWALKVVPSRELKEAMEQRLGQSQPEES